MYVCFSLSCSLFLLVRVRVNHVGGRTWPNSWVMPTSHLQTPWLSSAVLFRPWPILVTINTRTAVLAALAVSSSPLTRWGPGFPFYTWLLIRCHLPGGLNFPWSYKPEKVRGVIVVVTIQGETFFSVKWCQFLRTALKTTKQMLIWKEQGFWVSVNVFHPLSRPTGAGM